MSRRLARGVSLLSVLLGGIQLGSAQAPPSTMTTTYTHSSGSITVNYALHSLRGPNFDVYVQNPGGGYTAHTPSRPARTYLGTVDGYPGAIAAAQLRDDGSLRTTIIFEDGTRWKGNTLSMTIPSAASFTPDYPTTVAPSGGAGSSVYAADVAFDLTPSYYTITGSNVDDALEIVEYCLMEVDATYLRDAAILQRLGRVVVRTSTADDPYAGSDSNGVLLPGMRDEWNSVLSTTLPPTSYDLAAVIHQGAGGGLAYVGAIGGSNRYSANGTYSSGDFTSPWRHEAGHNWSSGHYEGGQPEGPTIMSGNSLARFSSCELAKIIGHRNAKAGILDNLGAYPFPLPPRANGGRAQLNPSHSAVTFDVLANDSDSNGEALTILSFDSSSNKGGAITRSVGTGPGGRDQLIYTPASTFLPTSASTDWFTYRIQDASGQQATGYVAVKAAAQPSAPWTGSDIGSVGVAGSSFFDNGIYTLNGAGTDIYGAADGFRFVSQPLNGDGEIVARVASIENTHAWAKSGVMIRETLAANSKNVTMALGAANGYVSQVRSTSGGSTTTTTGVAATPPGWVKLNRTGSTFTASYSADGATWTVMNTYTVTMTSNVYIGIVTSSHNNSTLCTATFDNVKVSTPFPAMWTSTGDIGTVAVTGSHSYNGGPAEYTVTASGADIWTTADEFRYIAQPLAGDGEIVARVISVENVNQYAKAGVMIRETLNANAKNVTMAICPSGQIVGQRRSTTGGSSAVTYGSYTSGTPTWVKINRTGDTFTTSYSSDGATWNVLATYSVTMASNIYIGLALTSHIDGTLCTSAIDNVAVTP